MPAPERRSIFNDMNLAEWRASMVRRDSSDFAMPGTTSSADPEGAAVQSGFHGVKMRKSGNQAVTTASGNERITWDTTVFATDPFIAFPSANSRYFVPEGLAGFWRASARITTDVMTTNLSILNIHLRKNSAGDETFATGTALQSYRDVYHDSGGDFRPPPYYDVMKLEVGDHIEWFADAPDENVSLQGGTSGACYMIFEYLGPVSNASIE